MCLMSCKAGQVGRRMVTVDSTGERVKLACVNWYPTSPTFSWVFLFLFNPFIPFTFTFISTGEEQNLHVSTGILFLLLGFLLFFINCFIPFINFPVYVSFKNKPSFCTLLQRNYIFFTNLPRKILFLQENDFQHIFFLHI